MFNLHNDLIMANILKDFGWNTLCDLKLVNKQFRELFESDDFIYHKYLVKYSYANFSRTRLNTMNMLKFILELPVNDKYAFRFDTDWDSQTMKTFICVYSCWARCDDIIPPSQ